MTAILSTIRQALADFFAMDLKGQLVGLAEIVFGYIFPLGGAILSIVLWRMGKDRRWVAYPIMGIVMMVLVYVAWFIWSAVTGQL